MKKILFVLCFGLTVNFYSQDDPNCKQGDCKNGKGTYVYNDGDIIFTGKFKNGDWVNGKATYKNEGITLEGTFLDDKLNGPDCSYKIKNETYFGLFKGGKLIEGEITIIQDNIKQYQKGTFNENNQLNGKGEQIITDNNGEQVLKGLFKDGILNDKQGYIEYANGSKYKGEVKDNSPNGYGKITFPNKDASEEGMYIDGVLQVGYDLDEEIDNNSTTIPLIYEDGMYYIEVDINGTKIKTLFDTGCFGLAVEEGFLYSAKQDGLILGDTTILTVDANNNEVTKNYFLLSSVSVEGIPINVTPIIGQKEGQPNLFGMSLLKRMGSRFILDFKYNRINIIE